MSFRSLYRHGFARVAACTTRTALADPATNAQSILRMARGLRPPGGGGGGISRNSAFPATRSATCCSRPPCWTRWKPRSTTLVAGSADLLPLLLVGAPLRHLGALYNCALAIHRGGLLGVVPKIHLPNYREFYEPRHFVSGDGTDGGAITIGGRTVAVRHRPAIRSRRPAAA